MRFSANGTLFGGSTLLWRWPLDSPSEISLGTKGTNCYPLWDGVALAYAESNAWKLTQFAAVDNWQWSPFSNFKGNRLRAADGQWCATTSGMAGWFHETLTGPTNSYVYECCADALVVNQDGVTWIDWFNGGKWSLAGSVYPDTVRVMSRLLSYTDTKNGTRQRVFDDQNSEIIVTALASPQYNVLAFRWNGDIWLICQAAGYGNVIYKNGDTSKGIQFATTAYGPDLWLRPDGTGFVAWSTGPAETIGNNRRKAINLATDLKPLVPVTPEPEPLPVPDWQPSEDLSYVLTFYEPETQARYTLIEREEDWTPKARGVFWTIDRDDLQAALAECEKHELPLYAYWDSYEPYPADRMRELSEDVDVSVLPAIMAYPHFARSNADRLSDVCDSLLACMQHGFQHLALVLAFYRQIRTLEPPTYSWSLEKVLNMQNMCVPLLADQGSIVTAMCFAQTRANGKDGVAAFPEFQTSLSALQASAKGADIFAPTPPEPEPPNPQPEPEPDPMPKTDVELQAMAEQAADFLVTWRDPKDGAHPFESFGADTLTAEAFAWAVNRRDRANITASFAEMGYKSATATGADVLYRPQLPGQPDSRRMFMDDLEAASNAVDPGWLQRR